MKKVLDYLDNNFNTIERGYEPKHWGIWEYWAKESMVHITVNNETLQIRCKIDGKYITTMYGYLQTYKHIPRGEPDKNGYYARSTDEEVIKFINLYLNMVDKKIFRLKKIKNILCRLMN